MKDIKSYLHLYLGADVEVKKKNDKNFLMGRISEVTRASNHGDWIKVQFEDCHTTTDDTWHQSTSNAHYFFMNWDSIKLILRPLSDMTEEEKNELALLVDPKMKTYKVTEFLNSLQIETRGGGVTSVMDNYSPEMVRCLLSKGFDLFGLIEEGLAIKKGDELKQL